MITVKFLIFGLNYPHFSFLFLFSSSSFSFFLSNFFPLHERFQLLVLFKQHQVVLAAVALQAFVNFFVFPFLEFHKKFIPEINTSSFNKTENFKVGFRVDRLKDIFVFNQIFSDQVNVIFTIFSMFPNNFCYSRIQNVFSIQVHKVLW